MKKQHWPGGAMLGPVPPALVSCGTMDKPNALTIAWTGILNTIPPKTYISVRPERYSYNLIKDSGEFVINLPTEKIVKAVVNAVEIPVTVKMRTGWDNDNLTAVELAKRCENAGASMITVHGRTRVQMYAPGIDFSGCLVCCCRTVLRRNYGYH